MKDSDWFAPNVAYVVSHELFSGRSAVIFDPNTEMSRVELVSVIWRLAGKPNFDNISKPEFSDCLANSWYTAAVNWASENGIVNGVGDGLFDPDGQITREQIVTILYRYAKFSGMDTSASGDYSHFQDASLVSGYAKEAMAWAVGVGLIQGDDQERILPLGYATRAEVATMVMRYDMLVRSAPESE